MGYEYVELSDCKNSICSKRIGCDMQLDFDTMNKCLYANCQCTQGPTMLPAPSTSPVSLCVSCGYTFHCNFQDSLDASNKCLSDNCGTKCDNAMQFLFTPSSPPMSMPTMMPSMPTMMPTMPPMIPTMTPPPIMTENYLHYPFTRL